VELGGRFPEKLNPNATPRRVVLKATILAILAAVGWSLLCLKRDWHPEWWAFTCWELAAVVTGAVTEWQTSDE